MRAADFTAALLDPTRAVPEGLTDPEGRPAGKRFDVYRNNLAASLTDALRTGFPVLERLLGEDTFRTLALLFVRAHPPESRALAHYGGAMPAFLASLPQLAAHPYLPDVARLELAIRRSYHAADAPPLDAHGLTPEALMDLTPCLAPATEIVDSPYPIHAIWRRNTDPEAARPQPRPEAVLIARKDFDPVPHLLPPGGLAFARALDGHTLVGLALERAVEAAPGLDLAPLLGLFLTSGALTLSPQGDPR